MRTITLNNEHESYVEVIDEDKIIVKTGCLCGDFENRRIKKVGQGYNIKYVDTPCKHTKPIVDALMKQGYTIKKPKIEQGLSKLTDNLRNMLLKRAMNQCEEQNCDQADNLEIHRITPKTHGGLYSMDNCKVLCKKHHDLRNAYMWRNF